MPEILYQSQYGNSHALIIGINNYINCPVLDYARQDAEAVAEIIERIFKFQKKNIQVLLDEKATKAAINEAYLKYTQNANIKNDDRLIVFYAGHGFTKGSNRGEVGYLVPVDGNTDDLNTIIRWDEFTRNADLIPAKHIFFLMDACYGGLAFLRQPSFGGMRFIKDMLKRRSRQVLTAGKADEPVADGQGIKPGHSIFTSYLLNGLEGAAATKDGLITASGLMAYVYEQVSKDQYSHQTPHYGFIDGDGDFIFDLSTLEGLVSVKGTEAVEEDILINTSQQTATANVKDSPIIETMKELLADPSKRIKLNDFVQIYLKTFLEKIDLRYFPVQGVVVSNEAFFERIKKYEEASLDLQKIVILLAQWGNSEQISLLQKILKRMVEVDRGSSGSVAWLNLSWYPIQLVLYSAGIASVIANNYNALKVVLETPVRPVPDTVGKDLPINYIASLKISEISNVFKSLPGLEKKYVPRSEYLFKLLQPLIEDLLMVGMSYETDFDRFEILSALSFANHGFISGNQDAWGPIGRFGWKYKNSFMSGNPFEDLIEEANNNGNDWLPIKSGFFNKSYPRFLELCKAFKVRLEKLSWF